MTTAADGPAAGALSGRRVVVTRPASQAGPLVDRLTALGADVVLLPLVEIGPPADPSELEDALDRLDAYDWLVVTSPNGAAAVRDAIGRRTVGRPFVAAVGGATATALGREADLVPADQIADGLVSEFPPGPGRVLLAQADRASPALAAGLRAAGWTVDEVVAYRTLVAPESTTSDPMWIAARDRALDADAVIFTSGSAAVGWSVAVGSSATPIMVAIGPSTAAVARQRTLKISHVAADHSLDGVVSTVVEALNQVH